MPNIIDFNKTSESQNVNIQNTRENRNDLKRVSIISLAHDLTLRNVRIYSFSTVSITIALTTTYNQCVPIERTHGNGGRRKSVTLRSESLELSMIMLGGCYYTIWTSLRPGLPVLA